MRSAVRTSSQRPALVAVGPTAADLIERGHRDLELCDAFVVDVVPSADEMRWLAASDALERSFAVVLFDARDEAFWPVARAITREVQLRSLHPPWFVCSDPRLLDRTRMLTSLANALGVCVVDPGGCDPLDVALAPVAALWRSGLTGTDIVDWSMVAPAGSVVRARTDINLAIDEATNTAIAVLRCSEGVTLHAISEAAAHIATMLPNAELIVAAPMQPHVSDSALEVCLLTILPGGRPEDHASLPFEHERDRGQVARRLR